jgi:hypothetical protein
MLGHSMGEYVAATLNGTFTPQQGMQVVLLRGELFEQLGPGAMLTVALPLAEALQLGGGELSIAAANAPQLTVLAGTPAAIERTEAELRTRGVDCTSVVTPSTRSSRSRAPEKVVGVSGIGAGAHGGARAGAVGGGSLRCSTGCCSLRCRAMVRSTQVSSFSTPSPCSARSSPLSAVHIGVV